jgi:hypothetical protein
MARTLPNFCVVVCIVYFVLFCVLYMCTVLLPPDGYPIAVKCITSCHIIQNIQPYTQHATIYKTYNHIQNIQTYTKHTTIYKTCNHIQNIQPYTKHITTYKTYNHMQNIQPYTKHTTPQRWGMARTLPNFCVVVCIVCFVSFCVLYMCTVLLPPDGYLIAVKYIVSYHIIQNIQPYTKHATIYKIIQPYRKHTTICKTYNHIQNIQPCTKYITTYKTYSHIENIQPYTEHTTIYKTF